MSNDYSKWRIEKKHGLWWVKPPVGTFWGRMDVFDSFGQACANYVDQTSHFRRAA